MTTAIEDAAYQSAIDCVAAGEYEAAIQRVNQVLQTNPDAGRLWELRGQAHLAMANAVDAVSCLEHASCLVPLSVGGRLSLAYAYELTDRRNSARDLFVALANERHVPLDVLDPLARGLGRVNELGLALAVCTDAARRMPDETAPLLGMVFYRRRLGFPPEQVLPVLFRVFHLDPDDFDVRLTLARMLHEYGRAGEAADLLSVVEIEGSRCPQCLTAMQHIFEEVGDHDRVARCVDTLLGLARD